MIFQRKNKKNGKNNLILIIVLAVFLGLAGGIVGQIFISSYFPLSANRVPYWGEISLTEGGFGSSVVISGARKVIVEQETKISETIQSAAPSIMGIFRKKDIKPSNTGFSLDDYYNLNEKRGQGVVITNDGWLITSAFSPIIRGDSEILNDYVVISKKGEIYEIDKVIRKSEMNFGFIHIAGVKNLKAVEFVPTGKVPAGQQVLLFGWSDEAAVNFISGENGDASELVKSSDYYGRSLKLAEEPKEEFYGGFVFNLSGALVAVLDNKGEVGLIDNLRSAIKSILTTGEIKRAGLGISYINLENLASPISAQTKGVFVYEVPLSSPAGQAGLKVGDVITFINNTEISKDNELNHILQNYIAGEKISVTYVRNNEKAQVDISLSEF